jgi:hypothetical protein
MSEMWNEISRASLSASCFALFTSARLRSEAVTWDYGERAELRKVGEQGEIYLADRPWKVSRALASETVQLQRVEQRILVYFCTTLVREIDLRAQRSTAVDR